MVLPWNGNAVGGGGGEQEEEQPPGSPAAPLAAASTPRPTPAQDPTPAVTVELAASAHLEATVRSPAPGVLVWRRAWLPLYLATVDGAPAPTVVANLQRLGIEVPAGEHRIEIWTDRRPLVYSALGSLAGLVGLVLVALLPRRRRTEPEKA